MHEIVFAPEAEAQLIDLYLHIAAASSAEIAESYVNAIIRQCESLATFPMRGAARDDVRPGLRVFGFRRRASIAFEVSPERVTILGIYYGGRNLETALEDLQP
ncbi:MAG TPA: type II toxin-antitoxin system RelE/ParE family toxin [Terracidiphilus sp.]|nr:type II toxin-antitoxin system RelE/ParE family toxin [Terracidiphilus sp.]